MERFKNKLAIVVGATTIFGVAIVGELVNNGLKVLGLDTNIELLEKLALELEHSNGTFQYFIADLNKENEIINMINWIQENIGAIHILIYNSSTPTQTNLTQGQTEDWRTIFDRNVISLNTLTSRILKNMMENDVHGHIINISAVLENKGSRNINNIVNEIINTLTGSFRDELKNSGLKIKITVIFKLSVRFVADVNDPMVTQRNTELMPTLKCKDIVNAIIFILSMSSRVQVNNFLHTTNFYN
ncbi:dehydrogenase/reductase sdr family member 11 [Holotrichia oblita]|uniref:Dehydrogenase/reductase sdr family member 11 n=1 Tax=Holotrichia oblita TaxID=644536 RepID=A0ACB9SGL5_HOLOL|nr:dehydrogenase/reductase sdr family member 11 [Holotrichia oblita]